MTNASDAFYAGFDAYNSGTDLDPAEQGSHWQSGYDYARDDHHQTEAGILVASAKQDEAQYLSVTVGADVLDHLIQLGHRARNLSRVDEIILLTAYNGLMEAKYG